MRDLLLGRPRADLDVVVEGDAGALARRLGGEILEHERFATAKAMLDGTELDLATSRGEAYPAPGALPEVRPAPLREDLARRDFTINAMAVPLQGKTVLIDPHGGREDLAAGRLRVLHPGSFVDDPTRALRAARYAARFDFTIEPRTETLLRAADLSTVSEDRKRAELLRIAAEPEAVRGLLLLGEWGLLELPDAAPGLLEALDRLLARSPWSDVAERDRTLLAAALGEHGRAANLAAARPQRPSEGVELARGASPEELAIGRALSGEWLDAYVGEWRSVALEIGGDDLIAAGISEGPALGHGLAQALRAKLDGEVAGLDEELRVALEAAKGQG